jgi:hypothetical protein
MKKANRIRRDNVFRVMINVNLEENKSDENFENKSKDWNPIR